MRKLWVFLCVFPLLLIGLLSTGCSCNCSTDNSGIGGDWRPDGLIAYFSEGELYVSDYDGSNPTRIANWEESDKGTVWSPDGSKVAFVLRPDEDTEELYVIDADASGLIRLSEGFGVAYAPSWSPDGNRVAFGVKQDENWDIYIIDADGSDLTRITDGLEWDGYPAWSPNGNKIAFTSGRDGSWELYIMDCDGSNQIRFTDDEEFAGAPAWSPSGDRIAFFYGVELHTIAADGSSLTRLTIINKRSPIFNSPVWSVDGSEISFTYVDGLSSSWPQETIDYVINADGSNLISHTVHGGR